VPFSSTLPRAGCVNELSVDGGLAVTGYGFDLLKGAVQPFLMGGSEGLKLNADPVRTGPTYDGTLDEDRGLFFTDVEQKIHLHSCEGSNRTFEPTSFAREIQCPVNRMEVTLVEKGTGKSRLKSRILSHHHNVVLSSGHAAGRSYGVSMVGLCRCDASRMRRRLSFCS
jgi:hypothetical protein